MVDEALRQKRPINPLDDAVLEVQVDGGGINAPGVVEETGRMGASTAAIPSSVLILLTRDSRSVSSVVALPGPAPRRASDWDSRYSSDDRGARRAASSGPGSEQAPARRRWRRGSDSSFSPSHVAECR